MYKNISITHSLLLLPLLTCPALLSSERPFNPMEQSLYIPAPTEKGYGTIETVYSWVKDKEDIVLYNLSNKGYFKTSNEDHRADLNTVVQNFVTTNQPKKLCELLAAGRKNYVGEIKIEDKEALAAHDFLTKHKKEKMESLEQKVAAENKLPIDELTKTVDEFKKSVLAQIVVIRSQLSPKVKQSNAVTTEDGKQIRALKTGLVDLHHASNLVHKKRQLQDGYCSDTEQDTNDVEKTYSDENIAQKAKDLYTMKEMETRASSLQSRKVDRLLTYLTSIEEELEKLQKTTQTMTESK